MTPDEVRMLDNRYAILFIRGERPILDEKFDILKHPNVGFTTDGMVLIMTAGASTVFAADDPLTVINNLSTFIFGLIRAIGMILLGFGIVQVGLSLKSHDPSQRANGFLTLAGGVIITFAKEILNLITG